MMTFNEKIKINELCRTEFGPFQKSQNTNDYHEDYVQFAIEKAERYNYYHGNTEIFKISITTMIINIFDYYGAFFSWFCRKRLRNIRRTCCSSMLIW